VNKILSNISVHQKKTSIIPKIKMMSDFTVNKLEMTTEEDKQNIEAIKQKLRSIDQHNVKGRERGHQKIIQSFIVEGNEAGEK